MASLFTNIRRRRGLLLKILIAVPIFWFALIGLSVVLTDQNENYERSQAKFVQIDKIHNLQKSDIRINHVNVNKDLNPKNPHKVILEKPDVARLELKEKLQNEAREHFQRKENGRNRAENTGDSILKNENMQMHVKEVVLPKKVTIATVDPNAPGLYKLV